MLGRRNFLGTVGATAVALGALRTFADKGGVASTTPGVSGAAAKVPEVELLASAGLRPHARFGTCEVLSVERTSDGAVGVRLADKAGQPFDLELLGHDARTPGVARAGSLGIYMNNKGRGSTATVEEHGLAAMALARHLAGHEAAGVTLPVLPTLAGRASGSTGTARA
jgi:hypothetical protein